LAHISGDEHLIDAFKHGADIHTSTAMRVFNIAKPEDVTPNDRRNAKAVNFGVVYGISDFGLSNNLGISRKEAKAYSSVVGRFQISILATSMFEALRSGQLSTHPSKDRQQTS